MIETIWDLTSQQLPKLANNQNLTTKLLQIHNGTDTSSRTKLSNIFLKSLLSPLMSWPNVGHKKIPQKTKNKTHTHKHTHKPAHRILGIERVQRLIQSHNSKSGEGPMSPLGTCGHMRIQGSRCLRVIFIVVILHRRQESIRTFPEQDTQRNVNASPTHR